MEANQVVTTPLENQESGILAVGTGVHSMINMFNSYSASKENRETPAIPKKFPQVSAPGYQSTPLARFSHANRNLKKQKKILTASYQDNVDSTIEPNCNGLIEEENWSHINAFKRDQKLNNSEMLHQSDQFNSPDKELDTEFASLSMMVNYNLKESMNQELTKDMFTCNDESMTCGDVQALDEPEESKQLKSNCEVVNSSSVVLESQDDQDMKMSEEAYQRMDNTEDAHFQHLGNENIDNTGLSNPRGYSSNNDTISKSDHSDNESDNNFSDSDKNIPRQDSKEKFYNLLKAISLEYGINSNKTTSPTIAVTHPKTIEEETMDDDLLASVTAGSVISRSYDYKANNNTNTTDQQTSKTMLTNYVTATSVNSPVITQEVTATEIRLEESTNDSKEVSTQVNSPDMMLTFLCNTQGKATDKNKKYRVMHKRAHQSYRTSTFINPPSLSDSGSTNANSPSTKILDSNIVATPIPESAATHSVERNRCNAETPLLKSNISDIKMQPESVKSPVLQAPTANSEESHIIYEESRYIDDMSNTSAGISLLKSSKRYRRLFGGKKKNKFGDSTMSVIHSDVSMTSNTSILSKHFKKKKKTLAAQQSTKLLMSLNGNELHDRTVQSMTLLAIHDDVAQQKLALAKKYRKVEAEVFQSERTYQRHLRVIIKHFLQPLRNRQYLPDSDVDGIFSNIEQILHVNEELLSRMTRFGIGKAFAALTPFLKLYSLYASNYDRAIHLIAKWEKVSEDFASFKKSKESSSIVKSQKLMSLLIMPVQRIPRYKLLLEELLNLSSPCDKDYASLKQSVEEITKVVEFVNEQIREHQNYDKVIMIQNKFKGNSAPNFVAPGRKLIKEGPLWKVCGKRSKITMFFLFSDILVYARPAFTFSSNNSARNYECRGILPLNYCSIVEIFGGSESADAGGLVKLTCRSKSFLLYSNDRLEIQEWSEALKDAIKNAVKSRLSLKKLVLDSDVKMKVKKKSSISLPPGRFSIRRKSRTPKRIKECLSESCVDSLYPMRKELIPHHTPKVARYKRERSKKLEVQNINIDCDIAEVTLTPSKAVEETLDWTQNAPSCGMKKKQENAQCIIL